MILRTPALISLVLLLTLGCAQPSVQPMSGINAIVGDRSWIETYGVSPPARGAEDARIATHLGWVETHLRAASVPRLNPEARHQREVLLDALHQYIEAGRFPRRDAQDGSRRPRFVDESGTHCAVAELIRASGEHALVASVNDAHEHDYVADMREPALAGWASSHGFTLAELALIQPSYDDGSGVDMPSEFEQRRAEEERQRAALVPRPLTTEHMREVLRRFDSHAMAQACAGEHTGHWAVTTTLSIGRDLGHPRTTAHVASVLDPSERMPDMEACIADALREAALNFIRSAAHRYRAAIAESQWQRLDVYSPAEIEAAFLSRTEPWHAAGTRTSTLAECMRGMWGPLRVPVRVQGWNGEVRIRWEHVATPPMRASPAERARWYCVQSVLTYGSLEEHGARDHEFVIEVLRDGTVQRAP